MTMYTMKRSPPLILDTILSAISMGTRCVAPACRSASQQWLLPRKYWFSM